MSLPAGGSLANRCFVKTCSVESLCSPDTQLPAPASQQDLGSAATLPALTCRQAHHKECLSYSVLQAHPLYASALTTASSTRPHLQVGRIVRRLEELVLQQLACSGPLGRVLRRGVRPRNEVSIHALAQRRRPSAASSTRRWGAPHPSNPHLDQASRSAHAMAAHAYEYTRQTRADQGGPGTQVPPPTLTRHLATSSRMALLKCRRLLSLSSVGGGFCSVISSTCRGARARGRSSRPAPGSTES